MSRCATGARSRVNGDGQPVSRSFSTSRLTLPRRADGHMDFPMPTNATILPEAVWMQLRRAHEDRVQPWIAPHLARAARHEKHPVYDFLFEYYSFPARSLKRWQPGLGVVLQGEAARDFLDRPGYAATRDGVTVDPAIFNPTRRDGIRWLLAMLRACGERSAFFGCYGLHEWAMVYRAPEVRHAQWPLRFSGDALAKIVESQPLCCTHFDAFRFFTDAARPLNRVQPGRATASQFEQRGCLHANMDLYKWSYKLAPATPSEFIADAFALAHDIREVDMRASPYDFSPLGFAPIKIETHEGRAEYERFQKEFARRAEPIRARLVGVCERLVAAWN